MQNDENGGGRFCSPLLIYNGGGKKTMRLDKFLKVSRLIKRRTVAKDVSGAGKILINGRTAKPSTDVQVGDKLTLLFGRREVELEILEVADTKRADQAAQMYRILREQTVGADDDRAF